MGGPRAVELSLPHIEHVHTAVLAHEVLQTAVSLVDQLQRVRRAVAGSSSPLQSDGEQKRADAAVGRPLHRLMCREIIKFVVIISMHAQT